MSKNPLLEKIRKASKVEAKYLEEKVNTPRTLTKSHVPGFNLLMSGKYNGGYYSGLTIAAAPSKSFKTMLLVMMLKDYLDSNEDSVAVLYDSENGASKSTFESFGVPMDRVIWKEIMNIEELKFDIMDLLMKQITKGDKVFIGIDSIGNLASIKEINDALEGSDKADMTRAKQLKSLFRMITPWLGRYDIPMMAVNHVYQEIGLYPKTIMGGGQGPLLAADTVLFVTKAVNKDGKEIEGFDFTLSTHKSRFVRENLRIPLVVSFENGISRTSGLLELGLYTGTIEKKGHRYGPVIIDPDTGEVALDENNLRYKKEIDIEWFDEIANNPNCEFKSKIENYVSLSNGPMLNDDDNGDENIIDNEADATLLKDLMKNE